MALHLELEEEKLRASGHSPSEARRLAREAFGSPLVAREESREAHGLAWWDAVVADTRIALRGLRRAPGFHAVLIGTLAVAIGLGATIMAAVDAILLRPVPYVEADRTVEIWPLNEEGVARQTMTMDAWRALSAETGPFDAVAAYDQRGVEYSGPDDATALGAAFVSADFFRVLPVPPLLGRTIDSSDIEGPPVVVVSHAFWRQRLGGDSEAVGRPITLDAKPVTVIGVLPPDFGYPRRDIGLWLPMPLESSGLYLVWPLATLRGDRATAEAEFDRLARGLGEDNRALGLEHGARLMPFARHRANASTELAMKLLVGAMLAVLLVSAANAVNLLLFRGVGRRREFALRLALGAGRLRLVRQLLVETTVVAAIVGLVALGLAKGGVAALAALLPSTYTWQAFHEVEVSGRIVGGALAGAFLVTLFAGLVPAARASKHDGAVFRTGGLGAGGATDRGRLRHALVALELAFSTLLLVGGGLFARSLIVLNRVELGLDVDRLAVLRYQTGRARYPDTASRAAFGRRVEERLSRLPGVVALSWTDGLAPFTGVNFGARVEVEGRDAPLGNPGALPRPRVDPRYFSVVGTPIVRGRTLTADDARRTDERPVVVGRDFAAWLFGAEDPIGRRFRLDTAQAWRTVVGVAGPARLAGADDRRGRFALYEPASVETLGPYRTLVIRTAGDPDDLLVPIHRAFRELDPLQPVIEIESARVRFDDVLSGPLFLTWLMAGLAAIGLALGLVGLYGVLSYSVSQRSREIGIRMAVGATGGRIVTMVLGQAGLMVALGIALGLSLAAVLAPRVGALLYRVSPRDGLVFVGVPIVLALVAALAGLVPSRRASRVDPMRVLRVD